MTPTRAELIELRVRGRVQGVGFRPHVYRLARELGLSGHVLNDGQGVLIRASGTRAAIAALLARLAPEAPSLARVERIETAEFSGALEPGFRIASSRSGSAGAQITPDAVICDACSREIVSPGDLRFRYPFTTCTACGPRLSIARGLPYDRATTTYAEFALCPACSAQYNDADDRRFHAESIACPACGPRARLERSAGVSCTEELTGAADPVQAAQRLLAAGAILAIKGLGGYQLACDATNAGAVSRLRERKQRPAKPFALMARDLDVIRRYCAIAREEAELLSSSAGPIVLLEGAFESAFALADAVAPGQRWLGFMLPTTALHVLLLRELDRPLVMTSGNSSERPPVLDELEAEAQLGSIADYFLSHDRRIAHRLDDSVVRVVAGRTRLIRRARGYAPSPLRLPEGFEHAPAVVAYGGDLKASFCLLARAEALLSPHQGDLDDHDALTAYQRELSWYTQTFEHSAQAYAADLHPEYASTQLAAADAERWGTELMRVQHHHAHAAACLIENAWPLDGPRVLAIVLDGVGLGADGTLWGGEFLWLDYRRSERLACLKPVAWIGGDRAAREPWRNLYAQLTSALQVRERAEALRFLPQLCGKPLQSVDRMLALGLNTPRVSSCGRLFDAVAAALGLAFDQQLFEGHAAMQLEALVDRQWLRAEPAELGYRFELVHGALPQLEPAPMWRALLRELREGAAPGIIAARFHRGLAIALAEVARALAADGGERRFDTVVLSGGCFQNRVLLEETLTQLARVGLRVLTHSEVPPNDGGLALGQAAVAAATAIERGAGARR